MKGNMFSLIRKQHKVLYSIVGFNAVNMMHHFFGEKGSIDMFGIYKSVLHYISSFISHRMPRGKNSNISCIYASSIIPVKIICTSFSRFSHLCFSFFSCRFTNICKSKFVSMCFCKCWSVPSSFSWLSISKHKKTFTRTEYLRFSTCLKWISTNITNTIIHIFSKLKGLLSACVIRTVKFFRLLEAPILNIENPFLLRNLTIPQMGV